MLKGEVGGQSTEALGVPGADLKGTIALMDATLATLL